MLMGSMASGDDGDGARDWKGITAISLDDGDGTAGRGAAPSRSFIPISAAPFHTTFVRQRLFSFARLPHLGRVDTSIVAGRLGIRNGTHLGRGRSAGDNGNSPEGEATGHPDASSALTIRARLIRPSHHFHPPYSCPARVRCAASKSPRKTPVCESDAARAAGSHPRKVAEKLYAPVRKVCDCRLWVRCGASRPDKLDRGN